MRQYSKLGSELILITKKLMSYKTFAPEGNEYLCTTYIKSLMNKIGFKVSIMAKKKGRDNVIGKIGTGNKSLVIACHMDTVPAGEGWKSNPNKA